MRERQVMKIMEKMVDEEQADTLFIDKFDPDKDDVKHAEILKNNVVVWRFPEGSKRVLPENQDELKRGFTLARKDYEVGSLERDMIV